MVVECAWVGVDAKKIGEGGGGKGLQTGKWERWVLSGGCTFEELQEKKKIQTRALSLRLGLSVCLLSVVRV